MYGRSKGAKASDLDAILIVMNDGVFEANGRRKIEMNDERSGARYSIGCGHQFSGFEKTRRSLRREILDTNVSKYLGEVV
jgi:hypothetical protein